MIYPLKQHRRSQKMIMSQCHNVTMSQCHNMTMSQCHMQQCWVILSDHQDLLKTSSKSKRILSWKKGIMMSFLKSSLKQWVIGDFLIFSSSKKKLHQTYPKQHNQGSLSASKCPPENQTVMKTVKKRKVNLTKIICWKSESDLTEIICLMSPLHSSCYHYASSFDHHMWRSYLFKYNVNVNLM